MIYTAIIRDVSAVKRMEHELDLLRRNVESTKLDMRATGGGSSEKLRNLLRDNGRSEQEIEALYALLRRADYPL